MLSKILAVLIPVIVGLAAVFITERVLQKLARGRSSADQRWRSTPVLTTEPPASITAIIL